MEKIIVGNLRAFKFNPNDLSEIESISMFFRRRGIKKDWNESKMYVEPIIKIIEGHSNDRIKRARSRAQEHISKYAFLGARCPPRV